MCTGLEKIDKWNYNKKKYDSLDCIFLQLEILSKFEMRIHKLEDTIVPVHRETDDLQRRQASILYKLICS